MKIVLLFPPPAPFDQPYLSLPSLTAFLKQNGHTVVQKDVNIEAFDFFLSKGRLGVSSRKIGERIQILENKNCLSSPKEQREYLSLVEAQKTAGYVLKNIAEARGIFKDPKKFYRPEKFQWAYSVFEGGLKLISREFPGSAWTLNNYIMKYSAASSAGVLSAVNDAKANLFMDYFEKEIIPFVLRQRPLLVGISITYYSQMIPGFTLARLIKKANRDIHVNIGGGMITGLSRNLKRNKKMFSLADSFIIFEGEHALLGLAGKLEKNGDLRGVPNIIFKRGNKIFSGKSIFVEDYNALPTPCFEGLPMQLYFSPKPVIPLGLNRGCYWHKCVFCHASSPTRQTFRKRAPERLVEDIRSLSKKHNTPYFFFSIEAVSPQDLSVLAHFLDKGKIKINWQCQTRLDKGLTRRLCALLAKAGCRQLVFGFESASQRVLDLMQKGTDARDFRKIIKNCYNEDIAVNLQLFWGFPGETKNDLEKTYRFLWENKNRLLSISWGNFVLHRDSAIYNSLESYGIKRVCKNRGEDLTSVYSHEPNTFLANQWFDQSLRGLAATDFPFLGINNTSASQLVFLSHYKFKKFKKLIIGQNNPHPGKKRDFLKIRPVAAGNLAETKCGFDIYEIAAYLSEDIGQKPPRKNRHKSKKFYRKDTAIIHNDLGIQLSPGYQDLKFLLKLCDGKRSVKEIIPLFAAGRDLNVREFTECPGLIRKLLDKGILTSGKTR